MLSSIETFARPLYPKYRLAHVWISPGILDPEQRMNAYRIIAVKHMTGSYSILFILSVQRTYQYFFKLFIFLELEPQVMAMLMFRPRPLHSFSRL